MIDQSISDLVCKREGHSYTEFQRAIMCYKCGAEPTIGSSIKFEIATMINDSVVKRGEIARAIEYCVANAFSSGRVRP